MPTDTSALLGTSLKDDHGIIWEADTDDEGVTVKSYWPGTDPDAPELLEDYFLPWPIVAELCAVVALRQPERFAAIQRRLAWLLEARKEAP